MRHFNGFVKFFFLGDPCPQPSQLNSNDLEVCTPRQFHDYFWGSEVSYIASYVCLALVPFGNRSLYVNYIINMKYMYINFLTFYKMQIKHFSVII